MCYLYQQYIMVHWPKTCQLLEIQADRNLLFPSKLCHPFSSYAELPQENKGSVNLSAFHTHSHRNVSSFLKVNKLKEWTIYTGKYLHPFSPWAGLEYNLTPFLGQITSLQLDSTMSNAKIHFRRRGRQTKVPKPNYFSFRRQKGRPHQWNSFIKKDVSWNCSLHCVNSSIFFTL